MLAKKSPVSAQALYIIAICHFVVLH